MVKHRAFLSTVGAAAALFALLVVATGRRAGETSPEAIPLLGTPGAPTTSKSDLARTVAVMRDWLRANRGDTAAAVSLADALLRQTRVTGNPGLAIEAEAALGAAVAAGDYGARRMLATVLLSQHRFRESLTEVAKAQAERPSDAWNYGVEGDAHLELGEYDQAFAAFERMMALRPSAAAYARASYASELRGDLEGALKLMQMAAEATNPQDPESRAWHTAQLGHLTFELGRLDEARRYFERADFFFPGHPFAAEGLCRVKVAEGDHAGALILARQQSDRRPSADLAALLGDLSAAEGRSDEAEHYYAMAESMWRYDMPEPVALARFLADRDRKIPEAVALARQAQTERRDIFTEDALAWALFKADRIPEALDASGRALATGARNRHLLAHAAVIQEAAGNSAAARRLANQAVAGNPHFDLSGASEAEAVLRRLAPQLARR